MYLLQTIHAINEAEYAWVQTLWDSAWTPFMLVVTHLADWWVVIPVVFLIGVWFLSRGRSRTAIILWTSFVFAYASTFVLKFFVHMIRPPLAIVEVSSKFSFPSGHATIGTVIFGSIIYALITSMRPSRMRVLWVALSILGIALIAFSRVYLGAHWLSDVIGGMVIGIFWLIFFIHFSDVLITLKDRAVSFFR